MTPPCEGSVSTCSGDVRLGAGGPFMGMALAHPRVSKGLDSDPTFVGVASAHMAVGCKLGIGGPLKRWSWSCVSACGRCWVALSHPLCTWIKVVSVMVVIKLNIG